jgi:hypothetical protein
MNETLKPYIMAGIAVTLIAVCVGVITFYPEAIKGEGLGIISTVVGASLACLKDVYSYEFGSSRGSREKDQLLAEKK